MDIILFLKAIVHFDSYICRTLCKQEGTYAVHLNFNSTMSSRDRIHYKKA
jgi:hypothetical protein